MKSFRSFFTKYRILILSLVFLEVIFVADTLVHETGHLLAALISGVPINKIKIIFIGFNPGLKMPGGLSSNSVTLINYAGGAFAALVCLCAYIFLWLRRYQAGLLC